MLVFRTWISMGYVSLLLISCMLYGAVDGRTSFYNARHTANWHDAKVACETIGGSLLKLQDGAKMEYIIGLFRYGFLAVTHWIGLNDIDNEGDFRWVDNTPLTFHNKWQKGGGSLTTTQDSKDCVYMDFFQMGELECFRTYGFICEVDEDSWEGQLKADIRSCWVANDIMLLAADEDTETVVNCPRNKTYFVPTYRNNLKTWDEADAYCKEASGSLAKIMSYEEQDMVNRIRRRLGLGYIWIGLTDKTTEGVHTWADGEAAVWPDFVTPSQPTTDTNENCIATGTSEWLDFECSLSQPVLCERDAALLPVDQTCSWRTRDSSGLWTEQQTRCQDEGGRLFNVKSIRHSSRFRSGTVKVWGSGTWIGMKLDNTRGDYRWTDGTLITWSDWRNGQPSGFNGSEPYGALYYNNGFVDYPATLEYPALCEKDVFQFRNAYIFYPDGKMTVTCHKYCAFQDGSRSKTWSCSSISSVTSEDQGCICHKENSWTILEPWLGGLDSSVLQDGDNTTCLSIQHNTQTITLSNNMNFDSDFEIDIALSPDFEHVRAYVVRPFTTTDMNSVSSSCELSGQLRRCKFLWGSTYACKCTNYCRFYVKVFQPVDLDMKVTICEIDVILWFSASN